ncbi:leucine-rich repeat domain-containing protein, partial [Candidatus Halobeggiatoa sp. HSG11]|nr:leucine-rich repeat domain-containing protein [Candidatus Halobeggiatoa sp. HSG11]
MRFINLYQTIILTLFCLNTYAATDCSKVTEIPQIECEALVALYNSTDGANWTDSATNNWNQTDKPCSWTGITCVSTTFPTNVKEISRVYQNLIRRIPTELGNLTNLLYLNLDQNQLTGTIPTEIGNLTNLQKLYLYGNQLTGTIPTEIGNLINLLYLDLSGSQLTGTIPAELGNLTNLQYLNLDRNQLTGTISIELGNLTNLQYLYLSENHLTGIIPTELGNLTNLQSLWLNENQLTGTIPIELGNLTNLQDLYLSKNQLTGIIPIELSNLQRLYLNNNQLCGEVPISFNVTNFPILESLDLSNNYLSVSNTDVQTYLDTMSPGWTEGWAATQTSTSSCPIIPTEITNCTVQTEIPQIECEALVALYSSTNGANWTDSATNNWNQTNMPCSWTGITCASTTFPTNVKKIDRDNQNLIGTLPTELGNLTSLQTLAVGLNCESQDKRPEIPKGIWLNFYAKRCVKISSRPNAPAIMP